MYLDYKKRTAPWMSLEAVPVQRTPHTCYFFFFSISSIFFSKSLPRRFLATIRFSSSRIKVQGIPFTLYAVAISDWSAFQVGHVFPIAAILTDCRQPSLPVIINGNTDDLQPFRAITLIDFYQVHVLRPAGTTPRSPKVNDFHFGFRLVQRKHTAIRQRGAEVGSDFPHSDFFHHFQISCNLFTVGSCFRLFTQSIVTFG